MTKYNEMTPERKKQLIEHVIAGSSIEDIAETLLMALPDDQIDAIEKECDESAAIGAFLDDVLGA